MGWEKGLSSVYIQIICNISPDILHLLQSICGASMLLELAVLGKSIQLQDFGTIYDDCATEFCLADSSSRLYYCHSF